MTTKKPAAQKWGIIKKPKGFTLDIPVTTTGALPDGARSVTKAEYEKAFAAWNAAVDAVTAKNPPEQLGSLWAEAVQG